MRMVTLGLVGLVVLAACAKPAPQNASGQALRAPAQSAQAQPSYGTPPAPPDRPPPADQLAAAQAQLAACEKAAQVPNAEPAPPCMLDHGWIQKMTLPCMYDGATSNAACYAPRNG